MKFFVFPLGICNDDKGLVFTPGKDEGVRINTPNWAGLIQAEDLNILIDTGMHPDHINNPLTTFAGTYYEELICPIMTEEDSILHQLNKLGMDPKDIDFVINTHFHFDHAGGNAFFPNATFLVQREHFRHAITQPEVYPPKYYLLPNLQYELIDGDITLITGIELIKCSGHVPGLTCVIIRLKNSGTIIIAGDAISIQECLIDDQWQASWNPKLARNSAKRLATIAKRESGQIFFGHDPEWWKTVKLSPQYYD